MPCCHQSTCAFCFAEYLQKQQVAQSDIDVASGGKPSYWLPVGTACPQCAQLCKGKALQLRMVEGYEETKANYLESPQTRAQVERLSKQHSSGSSGDGPPTQSPLKVGDDFSAMARKMLPFGDLLTPEPVPAAAAPAPADLGAGVTARALESAQLPVAIPPAALAAPAASDAATDVATDAVEDAVADAVADAETSEAEASAFAADSVDTTALAAPAASDESPPEAVEAAAAA